MSKTAPLFGSERGVEIVTKIQILLKPDQPAGAPQKDIINQLYFILNVLDSKANGLLRFNSLFLTILVALLTWMRTGGVPTLQPYQWIAYTDLVLALVSSLFCLTIMKVNWKFLGHIRADGAGIDEEIRRLGNVIDDRTHFYWLAWWGTMIAILLPALTGVGVELHAICRSTSTS